MLKVITPKRATKHTSRAAAPQTRVFTAEEFEADTAEDRSIAILAEKRRKFLESLNGRPSESDLPKDQ